MAKTSKDAAADTPTPRSVAWAPFAERLAGVLETLEEDQYLILALKRTNRFVQFAAQGAYGMRAETTSNSYLPLSRRLGPTQLAGLAAAGWHDPTGSPEASTPENDPDGSPNYFIEFAVPVPFAKVAELTVDTLAENLRVPHPGFLEYNAFDADGNAIELPALGLKRTTPPMRTEVAATLPDRLLATFRDMSGIDDLDFDEDGDIGLRYGSILAFARLSGHPPNVRIQARLLAGLDETPELLSRLNEINGGVCHLHLVVHGGAVYALADVLAEPFVSAHIVVVFQYFCQIADGIGGALQAEFGGETGSLDSMPSVLKH